MEYFYIVCFGLFTSVKLLKYLICLWNCPSGLKWAKSLKSRLGRRTKSGSVFLNKRPESETPEFHRWFVLCVRTWGDESGAGRVLCSALHMNNLCPPEGEANWNSAPFPKTAVSHLWPLGRDTIIEAVVSGQTRLLSSLSINKIRARWAPAPQVCQRC